MKKVGLLTLLACFFGVSVYGLNVAKIEVEGEEEAQFATDLADLNTKIADLTDSDSATITLLADINVTNEEDNVTLIVPEGKHVLLNLAGHGITQTWKLKNLTAGDSGCYWVYKNNGLRVPDEEVDPSNPFFTMFAQEKCSDNADINVNALIYNAGNLRIISEGNKIVQMNIGTKEDGANPESPTTICNAGNLVVEGGIFIGPNGGFDLPKLPVIWVQNNDAVTTIKGGTFLCYEGVSDAHKGPDMGPLRGGVAENWHISGGIFSTDEMAGTPLTKNGGGDNKKYSTVALFDSVGKSYYGYLEANFEAIEVPYTNANIDGYTEEFRRTRYSSYVNENNQYIGDTVKEGETKYTKIVYNGVCPDPVKMGKRDEAERMYCYNDLYTDRSRANGSIQYIQTESHATDSVYYERYRYAIKPVCVVVPTGANAATSVTKDSIVNTNMSTEFVYVQPGADLTVESGKLTVGEAGIVLGGTDSKIVVEPGATLVSGGDIVSNNAANIELTMDDYNQSYSSLLVAAGKIQESHPKATVKFATKCFKNGSKYIWQRFAVPTYMEVDYSAFPNPGVEKQWVCYYDESEGNWVYLKDGDKLEPFRCYALTNNAASAGNVYPFQVELVGNGNPDLHLEAGWNYLANAYTAPMNLQAWLTDLAENYEGVLDGTVWVQRPSKTKNKWIDIAVADILTTGIDESVAELQPMQAFVYHAPAEVTIPLKYKEYVYDPIVNPSAAPRRIVQDVNFQMAVISVKDAAQEEELLRLYEGDQFSSAYDNNYDANKLMNEEDFNLYFTSPIGNLARLASNSVENASITLQTFESTEFTMTFNNVTLEGYAILDNVTLVQTDIKNGKSYAFTADANTTADGRFTIVKKGGEDPTAIENTTVYQKADGIYTLTGQYVGMNLNVLPAGVYVVNGQKVVK